MTCHICNEVHALFVADVDDDGTINRYLLCGNCIDMLKRGGAKVRT